MRALYKVWAPILVRWGDMDAYGHVNNATFATYFECARVAYFDAVNIYGYKQSPDEAPALVSATINFRRQVRYPAELECGARVTRLGNSSWTMDLALFHKGEDKPVADGPSVLVWTDYATEKAIPIPGKLRDALTAFEKL